MDKLERIVHLVLEARTKARRLAKLALDPDLRQRAANIMKRVNESHEKIQALNRASKGNGKGLDKAMLESAMDDLIATFDDVNRKLDDLLAKAKK
jgi:hypothetical protein